MPKARSGAQRAASKRNLIKARASKNADGAKKYPRATSRIRKTKSGIVMNEFGMALN